MHATTFGTWGSQVQILPLRPLLSTANDPKVEIAHLTVKTSFLTCVQSAASIVRLSLVERLPKR